VPPLPRLLALHQVPDVNAWAVVTVGCGFGAGALFGHGRVGWRAAA